MATSEADICNLGLARVGQKQLINSLSDNTTQAQLCAALYPLVRDEVLGSFPWPFAGKHALLTPLVITPKTAYTVARAGWQNAYSLPGDCITPRYIFSGVRPGGSLATSPSALGGFAALAVENPFLRIGTGAKVPFEIENGDDGATLLLLSDWVSPELVYTARVTEVPAFHPLFVSTLGWKMAAELALALPVKAAVGDAMDKKYQAMLLKAAAAVFRGQQQEDPQPDSEIIAGRG